MLSYILKRRLELRHCPGAYPNWANELSPPPPGEGKTMIQGGMYAPESKTDKYKYS